MVDFHTTTLGGRELSSSADSPWKAWVLRNDEIHGSPESAPGDLVDLCGQFLNSYHMATVP